MGIKCLNEESKKHYFPFLDEIIIQKNDSHMLACCMIMRQRIVKIITSFILILSVNLAWCQSIDPLQGAGVIGQIHAIQKIDGSQDKDSLAVYVSDLSIKISKSEISLNDALTLQTLLQKTIASYPHYNDLDYLLSLIEIYIAGNRKDTATFEQKISEARKRLSNTNRISDLVRFNVEIAHYQYANDMVEEGRKSYEAAEQLINKIGFKNLEKTGKLYATVNANSFGLMFYHQEDYARAERYFLKGLERAQEMGSEVWEGIISGNLAMLKLKEGDYDEAEALLIKDYQNSRKNKEVGSSISALFALADIQIGKNQVEHAKAYLDTAKILLNKVGTNDIDYRNDFAFQMSYRLGMLALASGNIEHSRNHFKDFYDIIVKDQDRLHTRLRAFNSDRYLIEDNAYKLVELEKEQERNLFILGVFSLLIVLGVVLYYLQVRYNKNLSEKNAKIEAQAKNLQALNEQKSKLFSIVAHDVRGPIGALSKLLELYKEEDITQEELIKYSNQVGDTLSNLKVMLDNLLNWARSSMDEGLLPRKVPVNIAFISSEIKRQLTAQLEGKGLEVLFTNSHSSKEVWIETDPAFLTVIIRNLLSNAIKFTQPNTSIGFDIFLDEKANKVEISISDKGAGLSEQVIQEILQSNTGVMSKPGTKGEVGSGIGLMLCKEFTKALGGQLSAKSVINRGSTFIVSLPIR